MESLTSFYFTICYVLDDWNVASCFCARAGSYKTSDASDPVATYILVIFLAIVQLILLGKILVVEIV
jgi:hypothetical protein